MAVTLSLDVPEATTLGSGDVATEFVIPQNARRLFVYFETNTGKYFPTGTDGTAISAEADPVPANQWFEIKVPGVNGRARNLSSSTRKMYLASATASTVVHTRAER